MNVHSTPSQMQPKKKNKSVRKTMRLNWPYLGQFGRLFDCFPSHFRPFSFIIGSLKKTHSLRTNSLFHAARAEHFPFLQFWSKYYKTKPFFDHHKYKMPERESLWLVSGHFGFHLANSKENIPLSISVLFKPKI